MAFRTSMEFYFSQNLKTPPSHEIKLLPMRRGGGWEKSNLAALDNELEFESPTLLAEEYKNNHASA